MVTLTDAQYGFHKYRSTQLTFLNLNEYVQNMEPTKFMLGIFIACTKAIVYINLKLLIDILPHYGIYGLPLQFMKCYNSDISRYVSINNHPSCPMANNSGVPKFRILNDIAKILLRAGFVIYAKYTTILLSSHTCTSWHRKLRTA